MTREKQDSGLNFDPETLAKALAEPPPPRKTSTVRPPGATYSLQDRLPGQIGSIAPPPDRLLRAMEGGPMPETSSSGRTLLVTGVLVVVVLVAGMLAYRVSSQEPPAAPAAPAAAST